MAVIKWVAGIFGGLVVVIAGGVGYVAATFDPNDYKQLAVDQARERGWDLQLDGDLALSFWPNLAIDLPPTQISSTSANQSLALQDAQVSLAVMPLITQQRAEVSTVLLDSPVIRWDLDTPIAGGQSTNTGEASSAGDALAIAIGGLQLKNADIELYNGDTLAHSLQIPSLNLGALSPNTWVPLDGEATYSAPGLPSIPMTLAAEIKTPEDFSQIDIRQLALNALDLSISGDLQAVLTPLSVTGQVSLDEFNARTLAERFGVTLETQRADALSRVSMDLTLGNRGPIFAERLSLQVDDTRFTGSAGLTSLAPLNFDLDLAGDQINLDDYLAPAGETTAATTGTTTDAVSPLAGLAGINGDARLRMASLSVSGLSVESIEAIAEVRDRRINFTQLAANAYEGQILGNAVVNGRTAIPSMSADLEVSSLQIQGLLADLADFSDLSGTAQFKTNLTAQGLDADSVMKTLAGNANGQLLNGGYKGIAVDSLICDGVATLMGGQSKLAGGDTAFDAVRFNADIQSGVADFDTLSVGLVNLAVKGAGRVDLPGQSLDLGLEAALTGDKSITGCAIPSFIANAKLPLRCQGNFSDDPTSLCGFDSSSSLGQGLTSQLKGLEDQAKAKAEAALNAEKDELKAKTQAKIEEKKASLEDELKNKAAEKLKGLFK